MIFYRLIISSTDYHNGGISLTEKFFVDFQSAIDHTISEIKQRCGEIEKDDEFYALIDDKNPGLLDLVELFCIHTDNCHDDNSRIYFHSKLLEKYGDTINVYIANNDIYDPENFIDKDNENDIPNAHKKIIIKNGCELNEIETLKCFDEYSPNKNLYVLLEEIYLDKNINGCQHEHSYSPA